MPPRPKTYGARRSHVTQAGQLVNGTTAGESEHRPRKIGFISMRISNGREKGHAATPKEEKQIIPSQGPMKEDPVAYGTTTGEGAAPQYKQDIEGESMIVSPVPWSLRKRKMPSQDMLPPDTPVEDHSSRRKSIRRSVDGTSIPQNQELITENGFSPMPIDHRSPSYAKSTFGPNGVTENHQHPSVGHDINLKHKPSDLHDLGIWVAQLIRECHGDKNPSSQVSEQRQTDSSTQPERDIKMTDALENVEDVRMTRGKEKKRLQQLKAKELANGNGLSGNSVAGSGRVPRHKDAAPVERLLKNQLTDQLKQRLFESSDVTDLSANVSERNACGILLFNTIVDIGRSNRTSAAKLNDALEKRKDDAPFISAIRILASSLEVMSFINFYFHKADGKLWELPNVQSCRSTWVEDSDSSTISEPSGRAGTPMSNPEGLVETSIPNGSIDKKSTEKEKRSQEVIQALEAATAVLVQIQQGEAGTNYITPYASDGVFPNPTGQRHSTGYANAYGPPLSNPPTHAMAYGPPVGPSFTGYSSPFVSHLAPHPSSYASPYTNPMSQPTGTYASPYANPMVLNSTGPVGSGNDKTKHHDHDETRQDINAAHTPKPDVTGTEFAKGKVEAAAEFVRNQKEATMMPSAKAGDLDIGDKKGEIRAYDAASNGRDLVGNVDLKGPNVGDSKKQESINEDVEISSNNDLTDDGLPAAMLNDKNVTAPADNHKLFTGERLGDFTSVEKIDWLLAMGNGGKMPTPHKKRARSPSISPPSQVDDKIQMEVSKIVDEIMLYKDWLGHPGAATKQLFYASAEGQRLAAELKRLMVIAKPVINAIVSKAESEARLRFYQQLESRAIKEKRDREFYGGVHQFIIPPVQIQRWVSPVTVPTFQLPVPPQVPCNGPMEVPFVRRGNVIAAPPGGRNIEEEKKAETYGYPPMPGSRPGKSQQGQKRKKPGQH